MDFGVAVFATAETVAPGPLARLVEERGFESLFFAEHTHIPAERRTPYPAGGDLPRKYAHTYDLFVALTAAASATTRLRVGSGICLVTQRDPIITAKAVASVDQLSGGRLDFGVGSGWNREEMANHGVNPRTRMRLMADQIAAMKRIWTEDEASHDGEFVKFERIWCWPKPAQRPHPPIIVGGNGPTVEDRVLAFGDAWMPNYLGPSDDVIGRGRKLLDRADRPIELMLMNAQPKPSTLARFAEAGFRRVLFFVPSAGRGPVERALDRIETAVAELHGE
ncbi:LLM class F420-dependent oxidoreductase [Kutzneria sp. NPDC052558]|uniref:LLM class F420-dependent oxidoreductase n=1 Tax=Kutzneria sp. NPDC052558 TaxID=3364121 RepID=UPI0037CCB60E